MADIKEDCFVSSDIDLSAEKCSSIYESQMYELAEKSPNELLQLISDKHSFFLSTMKEEKMNQDLIPLAIITLGKACNAENHLRKLLYELMINISSSMINIVLSIQRYLVSLYKQDTLEKLHLDALLNLTLFLKTFQQTLPSTSLETTSILIPIVTETCDRGLKHHKELHNIALENLKMIKSEQRSFFEHHSLQEVKKLSENEKLHLEEPPEDFRSISVLPTNDDIAFSCSFLRPNIAKGKYKDTEHYLDVQFRLLREDFIKPLRDGITEYLTLKKNNKPVKNCKSVRVYSNAFISSEEFVDGNLLHVVQFKDKFFHDINWEYSKRFLTGNLLCFSADDFCSMLFATVVDKEPEEIKKGLLLIRFEEMNEKVLNLGTDTNFVVIEVPTLFESYRHNLKVLQELSEESLPMKNYIINVEKTVKRPQYLQSTTEYDMQPLFIPLNEGVAGELSLLRYMVKHPEFITKDCKSVSVADDSQWPTASELKLDESQYIALKSAIMKEFAIIQGPPGTGKTYVGLRTVQLLLHNIDVWYKEEENSLPILIVCYTNHALDQFLEGISKFTRKIVRIGGRGSNENLTRFQIKNLVREAKRMGEMPEFITKRIYEVREVIETLKKKIDEINEAFDFSKNHVFHENILKEHISSDQFRSLKGDVYFAANVKNSPKGKIKDWLETETFNEVLLDDVNREKTNSIAHVQKEVVEIEGEGDIEFIENQRDIDYYDFEDRLILRKSSTCNEGNVKASNDGWELKTSKKKMKQKPEYIRYSLENNPTMAEGRAFKIRNVWMLPIHERWQLYKFWVEKFLEEKNLKYSDLQEQLKNAVKKLSVLRTAEDLYVLENAHVVGMTTTGAAKYRHIIEARNPVVLIVEEAAEILESHIITSLTPKTQHVILIGDQQQLQPSPTVFMLAVKYGMNISLFERMIKNGMDYCRLSLQHRMRPEIVSLIVPHIYSNLESHESVTKFENIKGVSKNVFFVTHNFNELLIQDSKSKVNDHEAKFIVKLCRYLLLQGYEPTQITVLTTYSGQLFALKKLAADDNVRNVRFTVVDNFQGEENDIILISFVRSNNEGEIGFLKISNRVCVALSRAKKGLYCIGNFELLAQKSNLWTNILQTLTVNKSIGPSLCLSCQNHPDKFNEVAKDSDFDAVPDGGCNRKCEYRLPCGHSCTLFCHPYDAEHESIQCNKPCSRACEAGHPCKKKCHDDCKPCPVIVDKYLSRCGHTVSAFCGKSEFEIDCQEPCSRACCEGHPCPKICFMKCAPCMVMVEKTLTGCGHTVSAPCGMSKWEIKCQEACKESCKEDHPCSKKCYETCGLCEVMVDKTLPRCGHTVTASCGMSKWEIKCQEACKKSCKEDHPCSKKCYETCGLCKVMMEKTLPRCGHTVKAACHESKDHIKCENPCTKNCVRNHPCRRKCHEICGSCEVVIEKTLIVCGHSVKVACGKSEKEIKCISRCTKKLPCSHECKNKCYEPCMKNCTQLVEMESPVCGHSIKVKCCFSSDLDELSKSCLEPCKELLTCGHICRGNCSDCKQGNSHVACNESCNKFLLCGHLCTNKCHESCIVKCQKTVEIQSPVCGHSLKIECCYTHDWDRLSKKCTEPCREILPCSHACKGTCSSCYQGRIHVMCHKTCERILICGHKCESKCFKSCPPCEKPCLNRCAHSKCRKRCSNSCEKCVKPCGWYCKHIRCTRRCNEECDRDPCNEKCLKILSCGHQCVGYCGEPCPKECMICDNKNFPSNSSSSLNMNNSGFVCLVDCMHVFKEQDLRPLLTAKSSEMHELKMKACPKCGTIIRRNYRFGNTIKRTLEDIEKIKQEAKCDRASCLRIQRNLLEVANVSHMNLDSFYVSIRKFLSGNIRNIYELVNVENILNIVEEIECKTCETDSTFVLTPFFERLVIYMRSSREWMINVLRGKFLTVSEYQLQQLSSEIYRISLIYFILKFIEQKRDASLSPELEECASSLMDFKPFSDENVEHFEKCAKNMCMNDIPVKRQLLKALSMSGHWYRCSKKHIFCLSYFSNAPVVCSKCNNIASRDPRNNIPLSIDSGAQSDRTLDGSNCTKNDYAPEEKISTLDDMTETSEQFNEERDLNKRSSVVSKVKWSATNSKTTDTSDKQIPAFQKYLNSQRSVFSSTSEQLNKTSATDHTNTEVGRINARKINKRFPYRTSVSTSYKGSYVDSTSYKGSYAYSTSYKGSAAFGSISSKEAAGKAIDWGRFRQRVAHPASEHANINMEQTKKSEDCQENNIRKNTVFPNTRPVSRFLNNTSGLPFRGRNSRRGQTKAFDSHNQTA